MYTGLKPLLFKPYIYDKLCYFSVYKQPNGAYVSSGILCVMVWNVYRL